MQNPAFGLQFFMGTVFKGKEFRKVVSKKNA